MRPVWAYIAILFCIAACHEDNSSNTEASVGTDADSIAATQRQQPLDSLLTFQQRPDSLQYTHPGSARIHTGAVKPEELVAFARTLDSVPYQYASSDPKSGFDCSGFVTYVFNHFGIQVPRSSVDFTNVGKEIDRSKAKAGDLILFTGTDSSVRTVGHMGIVVSASADSLAFIHSSSGKANGVVVTPLNGYYGGRFVKVIRIFPQNEPAPR